MDVVKSTAGLLGSKKKKGENKISIWQIILPVVSELFGNFYDSAIEPFQQGE